MSQILVQESKYEWAAHVLENTKHTQIYFHFTDHKNGLCAVGVIAEAAGWNGCESIYVFQTRTEFISFDMFKKIHYLNDRERKSYTEIAQWLREQK